MNSTLDLEVTADTLEKAAAGLRKYRLLVEKILGSSPEEVRNTLRAMEGLTPAQIREACDVYKVLHTDEVSAMRIAHKEAEG